MANKNRSRDSKDFASKITLNPPEGGKGSSPAAKTVKNPSNVNDAGDPDRKVGQFTGRGSPGYQKK